MSKSDAFVARRAQHEPTFYAIQKEKMLDTHFQHKKQKLDMEQNTASLHDSHFQPKVQKSDVDQKRKSLHDNQLHHEKQRFSSLSTKKLISL